MNTYQPTNTVVQLRAAASMPQPSGEQMSLWPQPEQLSLWPVSNAGVWSRMEP